MRLPFCFACIAGILICSPIFSQRYNIQAIGVEQGLQSQVLTIFQDSRGFLWFGTNGGGVSRYDGKAFVHYTTSQGLSSNKVRAIAEDKNGHLWFGTDGGGIDRFDGKNFFQFTTKNGLVNNDVKTILCDKTGTLWIGTGAGVMYFSKGQFIFFDQQDGPGEAETRALFEDRSGNLWIGTDVQGVYRYDGKVILHLDFESGLPTNTIYAITQDGEGNMWFGTFGFGLVKYDGTNFLSYSEKQGLRGRSIYSMILDSQGNIWAGTYGSGAARFDGTVFANFTIEEGMTNNIIRSVCEDMNGNIWFGTYGGGANKFDGKRFVHFTRKEGLVDNAVRSMTEDKDGNFWFGTVNGVSKYDGKEFTSFGVTEDIPGPNDISGSVVRMVYKDKPGNLWFGTDRGLDKYDGTRFTHFLTDARSTGMIVRSMIEDKNGTYWLGLDKSGVQVLNGEILTRYSLKDGFSNMAVFDIHEDGDGTIWLGTAGSGVFIVEGYDKNKMPVFKRPPLPGYDSTYITSIAEDRFGNMWFGTADIGLIRLSGNKIILFDEADGLASNAVVSLVLDKDGDLWAGTYKGLSQLNFDDDGGIRQINNFAKYEGFAGVECNPNSAYRDSKGRLWFGTASMLTRYDPGEHSRNNTVPIVHILGIRILFEKTKWSDHTDSISPWNLLPNDLVLPYDRAHLTFNYVGINFSTPERVRYKIMLTGLEEDWSPLTSMSEITYSNIPPGDHTFRVIAVNEYGRAGKETSFSFTITPPWWRTSWFLILSCTAAISGVVLFIRVREKNLVREKRVLEHKVAERTVLLQKQKDEIEFQKKEIEEKNKDITDSIHYAKRIQTALLTGEAYLNKHLPAHFILYKPRDIVSGDFYWALNVRNGKGNNILLAAADCTGHGIPGAFMSMIGISFLNELTIDSHITQPDDVLNLLRQNIIKSLNPEGSSEETLDGIDMAFLRIDLEKMSIEYAGANIPVLIAGNNKIDYMQPDKFPIGKYSGTESKFTLHTRKLIKGERLYIFTDGFADQFGGPKGKKFKYKQIEELLISIQRKPFNEHRSILEKRFTDWKGSLDQVDDVMVIGLEW